VRKAWLFPEAESYLEAEESSKKAQRLSYQLKMKAMKAQ
jgi:hypothetical protein